MLFRSVKVYRAKHSRTGVETYVAVAVIPCSLECQIVKHALKNFSSYCRRDECHRKLEEVNNREALINRFLEELSKSGEPWYNQLLALLKDIDC